MTQRTEKFEIELNFTRSTCIVKVFAAYELGGSSNYLIFRVPSKVSTKGLRGKHM
jgi:hypothetical protein